MGLFDLLEEAVETVLDAPAQVAKVATKTAVSLPGKAVETVEGAVEGAEEGIEELEKVLDRLFG